MASACRGAHLIELPVKLDAAPRPDPRCAEKEHRRGRKELADARSIEALAQA